MSGSRMPHAAMRRTADRRSGRSRAALSPNVTVGRHSRSLGSRTGPLPLSVRSGNAPVASRRRQSAVAVEPSWARMWVPTSAGSVPASMPLVPSPGVVAGARGEDQCPRSRIRSPIDRVVPSEERIRPQIAFLWPVGLCPAREYVFDLERPMPLRTSPAMPTWGPTKGEMIPSARPAVAGVFFAESNSEGVYPGRCGSVACHPLGGLG